MPIHYDLLNKSANTISLWIRNTGKIVFKHAQSKIRVQKMDDSAIRCHCRIRNSVKISLWIQNLGKNFSKSTNPLAYLSPSSLVKTLTVLHACRTCNQWFNVNQKGLIILMIFHIKFSDILIQCNLLHVYVASKNFYNQQTVANTKDNAITICFSSNFFLKF